MTSGRINAITLLLILSVAAVGAIAAVACGGGDEDAVTKEELASALQQAVAGAAPAPAPAGPTAAEISALVSAAVAGAAPAPAPAGPTAAEISALVSAAVAAAAPAGVSSSEIASAVKTAVESAAGDAVTAEDIEALVAKAVEDAVSGGPTPLTKAEVAAIVASAVAAIPAPAPVVVVATPVPLGTQYTAAAQILIRGGAQALAAANGEVPRYGGTLLANVWEPIPTFDMHQTSIGGVYAVTAPGYNGLLATNPYDPVSNEIIPDLARSWEISDGGSTVTFHLAEGVNWHDGKPFSSADVKYTFERIKDPPEGVASPNKGVFTATFASIDAPDPNTVVIRTDGVAPLLFPLLANGNNGIIPKHISEVDPINALVNRLVGTGAFRLVGTPSSTLWEYERNPDYFLSELPYMDAIEYNIIPDAQAQAAALLTGKLHFNDALQGAQFDPDLALAITAQEEGLLYLPSPAINVAHFTLNGERPPFDDLRVRQAISEAIHRPSIAILGPQSASVGTGNFPLGPWALPKDIQESLIGYGPNMDARIANAIQLLTSYEAENGAIDWSGHTIQCSSNVSYTCPNGEIVQQMLKEIGVDVGLESLDVSANRGNELSGEYSMSTLAAGMNFDDPIDTFGQWFICDAGRWYQRRCIPELDALYVQQSSMGNFRERQKVVWEMDTIAMNDAAYLILHWFNFHRVQWDFVKTLPSTPKGRTTHARFIYTWLDLPEANRTSP